MNVNEYAFSQVSESCRKDLIDFQEYYSCTGIVNITTENFPEICNEYNSEKCQTVLKNPLSYIPNCKNYSVISEVFSDIAVSFRRTEMTVVCTFDESNNLCPVAEVFVNKTRNQNVEKRAIRQSCRSKKCTDIMIDVLPLFLEETKDAENLIITEGNVDEDIDKNVDEWIDYLKSDECTDQYNKNSQNARSSASTLKGIGSTLLVTISLIFTLF
ncbi:hypothetical protein BCR36DRAFT_580037 [Piromyces finnis]|uniref:Uncharacterized protein n=1 Tax=Piromyces finnis TaxID=1754191 RepID=A0A1Y1VKK1_9FUNG|nr:hypothetical protein BCR36DRAFT_580037 [Piromyces finnis]|eukprot:ORX58416.1 hypothetical protein BCR36DRAFT_580037 [Piromyces finnis]